MTVKVSKLLRSLWLKSQQYLYHVTQDTETLKNLSSQFYTVIPHISRRCSPPPVIRDLNTVKDKTEKLRCAQALLKKSEEFKAIDPHVQCNEALSENKEPPTSVTSDAQYQDLEKTELTEVAGEESERQVLDDEVPWP